MVESGAAAPQREPEKDVERMDKKMQALEEWVSSTRTSEKTSRRTPAGEHLRDSQVRATVREDATPAVASVHLCGVLFRGDQMEAQANCSCRHPNDAESVIKKPEGEGPSVALLIKRVKGREMSRKREGRCPPF